MNLFGKVRKVNLRNKYTCEDEDFIFMYRKHRITTNSIDSHYERYCKQIGISKKGNHKARKTALPKVADKTFINRCCFSKYSDAQKRQELEKTLNV